MFITCMLLFVYVNKWPRVDLIKQFTPALCLKFALCAHPFTQIYSNLASCICTLRSPYCIFSQILNAPNFMKTTLDHKVPPPHFIKKHLKIFFRWNTWPLCWNECDELHWNCYLDSKCFYKLIFVKSIYHQQNIEWQA